MPLESLVPSIVASFARRFTEAELDTAITQVAEAYLTSSFTNLSVLGMSTGQNGERIDIIMQTLEAARAMLLAEQGGDDAAAVALDSIKPLGVGFDFSRRHIE